MLKQLIVPVCLFLFSVDATQAQCNPDAVQKLNGKWTKIPEDAISGASQYGFPRAQVPALLRNMEKYVNPIKEFCPQPVGMDIEWQKVIGFEPLYPNGPQPNEVASFFEKFYCNNGKQYKDDDEGPHADIIIQSNWFFSFLPVTHTDKYFKGKEIMIMPHQLGMLQGYPYFEPTYSGADIRTHHRTVHLAMPGKLPYRLLTRQEVLEYMTQQLDKGKKELLDLINSAKIRPKSEQDAEKAEEAKYLRENYSDPGVAERYIANFQSDEQKRDTKKKKAEEDYKYQYDRLDLVRKKYENELDKPAILYDGNLAYGTINDNWTFVQDKLKDDHLCTPDCHHGHQFAILNEAYFDKKLPRGVPQFITVTFNLTLTNANKFRDPIYEKLKDDWEKKFNFARLAELLGK